jgi:hypothetical protein
VSRADHDLPALGRASLEPDHRLARPVAGSPAAAEPSPPGATGRSAGPWTWRRWKTPAAYAVGGVALFCAYLRLSSTSPMNSDSANILLMGWDLLHGNLLLHGWYMSDVSFYPTELPQYALLESFLGLRPETAHVAAAITYTLALLLAVLLARGGTSGRTAIVRTLIAAGIMVAPQLNVGVYALDMAVGHIGTSVPLLVVWLLLDRADRSTPRWWVPVVTTLLLAWVLLADSIVLIVGVAPLALVSGIRFIQGVRAGDGLPWTRRVRAQWYQLSLACAAVAAVLWAWLVERLLSALGGFVVHPVPFVIRPWHEWLHKDVPALWKVLQLYGADYRGLAGAAFVFAVLHLMSVVLVGWAVLRVVRRFLGRIPLVDQVLAVAILLNVVLYAITDASVEGAHEIAVVAPFGAALAARALTGPAYRPAKRRAADSTAASRVRLAGYAAGALVLGGYLAGLGYELSQPAPPPANSTLASWLAAHDLTYGLAGYWQASSTTVDSQGRVAIRALSVGSTKPYLWMAKASWYDPGQNYANFVVIDTQTSLYADWVPRAMIERAFGAPARTYRTGPYIILVWDKNLLSGMPLPTSTGATSPGL